MKICKICKKQIKGRSDKMFCSSKCKNEYHRKLKDVTKSAAFEIDKILHRNRSILLELIGKNKSQIKLSRIILERKKFRFKYHTHTYLNSKGKIYHYVYDLAWMDFSDDEILIIKS